MNILVVDDQESARCVLGDLLEGLSGAQIFEASDLAEARALLLKQSVDVALIDIRLSNDARNRDGLILVRELHDSGGAIPIVVTACSEMIEIRAAMRCGAHDYILKDDLCEEMVLPIVREVLARRALQREVVTLRARCQGSAVPLGLIGASASMARLRESIRRVAASDRPVLISGPTGCGKELVAQALHTLSPHPDAPLLDLNCGAIPESLMEAQLFGHERGAFTGAERRSEGYLSAVAAGTLFLDEIAELPLVLQAKLLRVLETGRFRRVGSTTEGRFLGRVVAATHADLEQRVQEGRFRADLFYRLSVLPLRVPPLEERREDIPALLGHFLSQQARPLRFTVEAVQALCVARWPGNVRQLRNLVDRAAVFCDGDEVTLADLPRLEAPLAAQGDLLQARARELLKLPLGNVLAAVEDALISAALEETAGNKSAAARLLGVHRKTIERRSAAEGE